MRSGIEHFSRNYAVYLRCLARLTDGVSVLISSSIGSAFISARAVPARVMSHHDVIGLGWLLAYILGDVPCCLRFALPRFAPRRLVFPPRLFVSGDWEPTGLLACFDGVMPTAGGGRGHALYVCSGGGVNRHASVVPSALLLRIGWRRERERLRCDTTGTAACFVMRLATGWRHAGSLDVGPRLVRGAMLA